MTVDPVTVDPDARLETALSLMDSQAIRHLPVVDEGQLVGVVSDRDLLGVAGWQLDGEDSDDRPERIREVMQVDPVTVTPEDLVIAAAVEVSVRGIGCLPVVEGGKLTGIVSEVDLLRLVAESNVQDHGAPETCESLGSQDAITASTDATLQELDALMTSKGIRHVPIVQDGQPVGMVSDRDMRRALGESRPSNSPITETMSTGIVTAPRTTSIRDAAAVMSDRKISALVTTSEDDRKLGIVTTTDLLEHALGVLGD